MQAAHASAGLGPLAAEAAEIALCRISALVFVPAELPSMPYVHTGILYHSLVRRCDMMLRQSGRVVRGSLGFSEAEGQDYENATVQESIGPGGSTV